jgi:E3 ubiquitin-protein ligase UBR4
VIKSYIKIRKLNLVKNKLVSIVEKEIEKIFHEMDSEKTEEKEKFIREFTSILQEGECDDQESRFLCEEISKILVPVKPDVVYFLNLNKAASQDLYIRGRMEKNPYPTTALGKTMAEVRVKICKEVDLQEVELIELIAGNKIVEMDLPVKLVYEQVWWP